MNRPAPKATARIDCRTTRVPRHRAVSLPSRGRCSCSPPRPWPPPPSRPPALVVAHQAAAGPVVGRPSRRRTGCVPRTAGRTAVRRPPRPARRGPDPAPGPDSSTGSNAICSASELSAERGPRALRTGRRIGRGSWLRSGPRSRRGSAPRSAAAALRRAAGARCARRRGGLGEAVGVGERFPTAGPGLLVGDWLLGGRSSAPAPRRSAPRRPAPRRSAPHGRRESRRCE